MKQENKLFAEYVTSVAFAFSLSAPQIQLICNLNEYGDVSPLRNPIVTREVMVEKGIVKRIPIPESKQRCCDVLTEAGLAIVPLLKIAGLYKPMDNGYHGPRNERAFQAEQQANIKRNYTAIVKNLN